MLKKPAQEFALKRSCHFGNRSRQLPKCGTGFASVAPALAAWIHTTTGCRRRNCHCANRQTFTCRYTLCTRKAVAIHNSTGQASAALENREPLPILADGTRDNLSYSLANFMAGVPMANETSVSTKKSARTGPIPQGPPTLIANSGCSFLRPERVWLFGKLTRAGNPSRLKAGDGFGAHLRFRPRLGLGPCAESRVLA